MEKAFQAGLTLYPGSQVGYDAIKALKSVESAGSASAVLGRCGKAGTNGSGGSTSNAPDLIASGQARNGSWVDYATGNTTLQNKVAGGRTNR